MSVTKINQDVAENELSRVLAAVDDVEARIAAFTAAAQEVSGYVGNALEGVIERLTSSDPGSLTVLVKQMREDADDLKNSYVAMARVMREEMDEAHIGLSLE